MTPQRIAELLEPYLGPPDGRRRVPHPFALFAKGWEPRVFEYISTYIDILQRWNQRINLTAIRNEEEIVTRHFGESLFAARHLFPREIESVSSADASFTGTSAAERRENAAHGASRGSASHQQAAPEGRKRTTLADIGSGAGFPGIPIKLWAPEINLTLIESNHKKATFLKEITRALTLTNVNIKTARAETLTGTYDVVTLRAVERFTSILPAAVRLVTPGGRLALLIGHSQLPLAQSTVPTLVWSAPVPVPESDSRVLAIATAT